MSQFTIKPLKPRNPLVAACRLRKAGRHGRSVAGLRRAATVALRREVGELDRRQHGP